LVVDSSPSNRTSDLIKDSFPWVRVLHLHKQTPPHDARNQGARVAEGRILVFTDPDVYARPDWLSRLIGTLSEECHAAVGAVDCHDDSWLDWGAHFDKYHSWLPGSKPRGAGSHTANLAIKRELWQEFGGFPDGWGGDAAFAWWLKAKGLELRFAGDAVVAHDHSVSFRSFLAERYRRGLQFVEFRIRYYGWSAGRTVVHILLALTGVRTVRNLMRRFSRAKETGLALRYLVCLPIVVSGQIAWQAGETAAELKLLARIIHHRGTEDTESF
jgi:GT2 family glycosyltransferase